MTGSQTLKFTLIMATVDRVNEINSFLESLKEQTYRNFELIIADQNDDDRLDSIIKLYNS